MCTSTLIAADLFAGFGGFTEGAESSGHAEVVWAGNHWRTAVEVHELNHPHAHHACQDLNQADFEAIPDIDLVLAGPSCPGHSPAAQPARAKSEKVRVHHDALRSNAWAVVACVEAKLPSFFLVENVTHFRRWKLLPVWCSAFEALGYSLETHVLRASYFGVPQRRDRFFVVGVRGKKPLGLTFERQPELAIGGFIDLEDPGPSGWSTIADATSDVKSRISKARRLGRGEIFLTQHVTGHPGVPLHEPIRTVTTQDQWAIVRGELYRPLTIRENARAMGFPDSYQIPDHITRTDAITGLGNAVPPPLATTLLNALVKAA